MIDIMMRFLKELFKPSLKCERVGHKDKTITRIIRRYSNSSSYVMEDYKAKFTVCTRCNKESEPFDEQWCDGYHRVTMPTEMRDELRSKGYLIIERIK